MKYIKLFEQDKERWLEIDLLDLCEYIGSLEQSIKILRELKKTCQLYWVEWDNGEISHTSKSCDFTYSTNPEGVFFDNSIFSYEYIKSKKVRIIFNFSYVTLTDEILPFIDAKKYNI